MEEKRQPAATAADDSALVARMAAGDSAALASLYDRYASLVYSVACRVARDDAAAEEILQDVFYQLWRMAARFDPARGSVPGWLAVAARNRAISWLRRQHGTLLDFDFAPDFSEVPAVAPSENPIHRDALVAQVRSKIDSLPDSQRSVMELAYFDGMSHSEIAERTGKPLGTVKTLLRDAVHALRQALAPSEGERKAADKP